MGGHRLNTQGFRCVVSGIDEVQPPFHGVEVGVVRAFASDECVNASISRLRQHVSGPSGDYADSCRPFRASRNQGGTAFQGMKYPIELESQRFPRGQTARYFSPGSHGYAAIAAQPSFYVYAQPLSQYRIVSDLGMDIQRDVSCVERN